MSRINRPLFVVSLAAVVAGSSGCNFVVKHPAATAAIAGGTMGFGTCVLESDKTGTCAIIGGTTGLAMGVIAGLALWAMGGDDDERLVVDPALANPEDGPSDIAPEDRGDLDPRFVGHGSGSTRGPEPDVGSAGSAAPVAPGEPVVEPAPPPALPPPPVE